MNTNKIQLLLALSLLLISSSSFAQGGEPSTYTNTKYPIVLIHGNPGGEKLPYIGSFTGLDYFHGIKRSLKKDGAKVYVPDLNIDAEDSFQMAEKRGKALISYLDKIAGNSNTKFNLFGHSMGSPTSRYVAHHRPDLVASVVSIGGLNRIHPQRNRDSLRRFNEIYTAGLPPVISSSNPSNCDVRGAELVNGIRYLSWSGSRTFKNSNFLDPMDAIFLLLGFFDPPPGTSDGAVAKCESHLGKVIRDNYQMNHMDQVNQLFGIVALSRSNNKPKPVYRMIANMLKEKYKL